LAALFAGTSGQLQPQHTVPLHVAVQSLSLLQARSLEECSASVTHGRLSQLAIAAATRRSGQADRITRSRNVIAWISFRQGMTRRLSNCASFHLLAEMPTFPEGYVASVALPTRSP
jgi:hypothetical protein